nr:MAG TPA_asm: hypothetical protein [Caudoviricetes sp.]
MSYAFSFLQFLKPYHSISKERHKFRILFSYTIIS